MELIYYTYCSNFTNNNGSRGVVFVIGNVVTIKGDSNFEKSIGPALRVSEGTCDSKAPALCTKEHVTTSYVNTLA